MSILIEGVKMPKDGEMLCVNIYPDGKVCINLDLECKQIATAVPVPPHGRLIDVDALLATIRPDQEADNYGACTFATVKSLMRNHINAAPTIISASEEGE